jgi:hypothetical protein
MDSFYIREQGWDSRRHEFANISCQKVAKSGRMIEMQSFHRLRLRESFCNMNHVSVSSKEILANGDEFQRLTDEIVKDRFF